MNRRHTYLLAALAAILALGRQAPAADDSEARIQALEQQLAALSNEPAERTNTPTDVTTDYDTLLVDVIARF
jgi:hypothetical protein